MIFSKFNVKELTRATLVCKRWNTMITNTDNFKKRVWVRCYSPMGDLDRMRNTTRAYENFKLSDSMGGGPVECIVLHYLNRVKWKKVYLFIENLECPFLTEIMNVISNTVEELELRGIQAIKLRETCCFPKLKRLRLVNCHEFVFEAFLFRTPVLRTYSVEAPMQPNVEMITLLREKPHIQHLHLKGQILSEVFARDLTDIVSLDLITLNINNDLNRRLTFDQEKNIASFIGNQKTLKHLILNYNICNRLIFRTWNNMPRSVSHITFKDLTQEHISVGKLKVNKYIRQLDFHGPLRTMRQIRPFLIACPNLQRLYVQYVTEELISYCGQKMLRLVLLKYQHATQLPLKKAERLACFLELLDQPLIRNRRFDLFALNFENHILGETEYGWYKTPVYHNFFRFY
ncbi:unnamed protein product [Diamesa serratosioi]